LRLFYLDPGLRNELGHHANSCRFITGAVRRRGIEAHIHAFAEITAELRSELKATAHFRHFTYHQFDRDPICGWLMAFHRAVETTRQDLAILDGAGADDIVYLNSALAPQLLAVAQWLALRRPERRPAVIVEFTTEPGLAYRREPDGRFTFTSVDPREDPRATLFRFVAHQIPPALPRLHLATFDPTCSSVFALLLDREIAALPLPHSATTSRRDRSGRRPVTIATIGHQRAQKGYALMPEIAKQLLEARSDIRLLIHNGDPAGMPTVQQALRHMGEADRRIMLDERTAGPAIWAELLDSTDLMLCPYVPERYIAAYSAVLAEAVANGIPAIVPEGTAMSKQLRDFGVPGAGFEHHDARSIAYELVLHPPRSSDRRPTRRHGTHPPRAVFSQLR
jgi:hypothetical protein